MRFALLTASYVDAAWSRDVHLIGSNNWPRAAINEVAASDPLETLRTYGAAGSAGVAVVRFPPAAPNGLDLSLESP